LALSDDMAPPRPAAAAAGDAGAAIHFHRKNRAVASLLQPRWFRLLGLHHRRRRRRHGEWSEERGSGRKREGEGQDEMGWEF
jgi:hypothetical protein